MDVIHKYLEIHGTVDQSAGIPGYVKNHGIIKGTEVQALLRQSKVTVSPLSFDDFVFFLNLKPTALLVKIIIVFSFFSLRYCFCFIRLNLFNRNV